MKNAGIAGGLALIGAGLFANAFVQLGGQAQAVPVVPATGVMQGPEEPTIVWHGSHQMQWPTGSNGDTTQLVVLRAWSDGTIEARFRSVDLSSSFGGCHSGELGNCGPWYVISSPTEGMSAAADINFDEQVDGADLAFLLSRWGDAPRNPMPPSDCPLGLLNPS